MAAVCLLALVLSLASTGYRTGIANAAADFSISGVVLNDLNADGTRQQSEPGMENMPVELGKFVGGVPVFTGEGGLPLFRGRGLCGCSGARAIRTAAPRAQKRNERQGATEFPNPHLYKPAVAWAFFQCAFGLTAKRVVPVQG